MRVFQQAKASILLRGKTQVIKLLLVFVCLLLCSAVMSLFAGADTAHAATLNSKNVNTTSSTHGGGCHSNGTFSAYISVTSAGFVAPMATS